jgi:poly-gamma-glutamate synthase PgsB/CapB
MKVIAKTTGTVPRLITGNQKEVPIIRLGMANIREQIRIVQQAHQQDAQAIVVECMALRPDLQQIESQHIVQPTIVVITNVRPDHLDVMGPSIADVRKAFVRGLPEHCTLFTTDTRIPQLCPPARGIDSRVVNADDLDDHTQHEVQQFDYIEHEENIALALAVCVHCGIPAGDALQNMRTAAPDPGALRHIKLRIHDKRFDLINAMAANDPESTRIIWHRSDTEQYRHIHIMINCRKDRLDRTLQFVTMSKEMFSHATSFILTGEATNVLHTRLKKFYREEMILDLGDKKADHASALIATHVRDNSLLFAMGNTVGYGMELMQKLIAQGERVC